MREKIKDLLGRGLSQAVVANAVGCTESYVSQLMNEEEFAAAVAELKITHVTKDTQRNDRIDGIKDRLLEQLDRAVQFAYKPGEVLTAAKALQTLAATSSMNAGAGQQQVQSQIVQVMMPAVIAANFTRNSHNEIIEVEGRSMATLTPAALRTLSSTGASQLPKGEQHVQIPASSIAGVAISAAQQTAAAHRLEAEVA